MPVVNSKTLSNLIAEDSFSGHGFVPFVGSGFSAASGILMGQEFGNFLAYSIYRVVKEKHNLFRDGWPKYPRDEEVDAVKEWVMKEFKVVCKAYECKPVRDEEKLVQAIKFFDSGNSTSRQLWSLQRPLIPLVIRSNDYDTWQVETQTKKFQEKFQDKPDWGLHAESGTFSRTSNQFVLERAIRSMHDWRSMLQLLAQLQTDASGKLHILEEADASVIDSFNVFITRDRQINLGHKMLAHLAGPLRIRTVLTTNFDNLIETAFEKLLRPLSVVSVSCLGELPDPKSVRSKETIVKLHGELTETRADFSLDDEPSPKDKETFARYIRGEFDASAKTEPIANQVLVLGFSGLDIRIIQMLKYTLDTRAKAKIYWVCHGANEPERVKDLFGPEYEDRVIIHQTERPDLFLYELYQVVTLCLPSGGFSYEFTHKVPPENIRNVEDAALVATRRLEAGRECEPDPGYGVSYEIESRKVKRRVIAEKVGEAIVNHIRASGQATDTETFKYPSVRPVAIVETGWTQSTIHTDPQKMASVKLFTSSGSANAMRQAFRKLLANRMHCLWIEMQDYSTPEDLLQDVLRILALRVGSFQLEHVVLYPGTEIEEEILKHLKRLLKFLRISQGKWALFFYGRSIPGAASGWKNQPWSKDQLSRFKKYLTYLRKCGFHTVYTPMTLERHENEIKKVATPDDFYKELGLTRIDGKDSFNSRFKNARILRNELAETQCALIGDLLKDDKQTQVSANSQLGLYSELQDAVVRHWIRPAADTAILEEATTNAKRYYQKLRFLYTSTLFRQSRHTSAFFSDAVFPCPIIFNVDGLDNDWVRSLDVNRWVSQLGSIDVFFYKPGGYSWKYRDMRIGLQNKLEAIPFHEVNHSIIERIFENVSGVKPKAIKRSIKKLKPLSYATQLRSKSHFEIATWYWKAFNATGHYLPFIESLYHHFECLSFIEFARPISIEFRSSPTPPIDVSDYQRNLARTSMLCMIKSLRTAKPWIKFWLSGVEGNSIFEHKDLKKKLELLIEKLGDTPNAAWSKELEDAKEMLISEMISVQASLKSEAGTFVPKPYHRQIVPDVRSDRFSREYAAFSEPKDRPDLSSDHTVWKKQFDSGFGTWLTEEKFAKLFQKNDNGFPLGKIYLQVKDYYDSNKSVKKSVKACRKCIGKEKARWVSDNLQLIEEITGQVPEATAQDPETTAQDPETTAQNPGATGQESEETAQNKSVYGFDNSAVLFAGDLFSDYTYLLIKRAKMEDFAATKPEMFRKLRKRWVQVTMICSVALDLCKHIHPACLPHERRQQIKLQTLYGLALGHLGRPLEANRRFNEASGILSKETRTPDEVETAIIRIRRAEATLVRCEMISDIIDSLPVLSVDVDTESAKKSLGDKKDVPSKTLRSGIEGWERESKKMTIDGYLEAVKANLFDIRGYRVELSENSETTGLFHADPVVRRIIAIWKGENRDLDVIEAAKKLFVTLSRMQSAFLDDVWVYLESAERLLAGYSQSSLWWGRVAALKLRAYSKVRSDAKYESLVFRRRLQHDSAVLELRDRLLLISPTSYYAKIKCVSLVANAMRAIQQQNFITKKPYPKEEWAFLFELLEDSVLGILRRWVAPNKDSGDDEAPLLLVEAWLAAEQAVRNSRVELGLDKLEDKNPKDIELEIKIFEEWVSECDLDLELSDLREQLDEKQIVLLELVLEISPSLLQALKAPNPGSRIVESIWMLQKNRERNL